MLFKSLLIIGLVLASCVARAEDNIARDLQARSEDVSRATKAQDVVRQLNLKALSDNNLKVVMGDQMEISSGSPFVTASNKYKTDKDWICSVGAVVSVALEKKSYSITCYDKDMKIVLDRQVGI